MKPKGMQSNKPTSYPTSADTNTTPGHERGQRRHRVERHGDVAQGQQPDALLSTDSTTSSTPPSDSDAVTIASNERNTTTTTTVDDGIENTRQPATILDSYPKPTSMQLGEPNGDSTPVNTNTTRTTAGT